MRGASIRIIQRYLTSKLEFSVARVCYRRVFT